MFSVDGANLEPWMIVVLLVCGAITSAVAGRFADSGWRSATKKDVELFSALSKRARNDREREVAGRLLDIAFRRVSKNTGKASTAGTNVLSVIAEYPYLTFFAIILASSMIGNSFFGTTTNIITTCMLGCICAGFDIFNRIIRHIAEMRRKRVGSEHGDNQKGDHQ